MLDRMPKVRGRERVREEYGIDVGCMAEDFGNLLALPSECEK